MGLMCVKYKRLTCAAAANWATAVKHECPSIERGLRIHREVTFVDQEIDVFQVF
jgi:hypothetical protein